MYGENLDHKSYDCSCHDIARVTYIRHMIRAHKSYKLGHE